MTKKITWDQWSKKVREQIEITRAAAGSFFHISMEERKVSIVFCDDNGHEKNIGHAELQFDRDFPTAMVKINADYLSDMGLRLSFEVDESGKVSASRLILENVGNQE